MKIGAIYTGWKNNDRDMLNLSIHGSGLPVSPSSILQPKETFLLVPTMLIFSVVYLGFALLRCG